MRTGRSRALSRIGVSLLTTSALASAALYFARPSGPASDTPPSNTTPAALNDHSADPMYGVGFQSLASAMYPELLDKLPPKYQEIFIARLAEEMDPNSSPVAQICLAPGTPDEIVELFTFGRSFDGRYNQTSRWTSTASGSTGSQGDKITLTYGFPPDGVTIPAATGFPSGTNQLNTWMNGIYGSQPVWKAHFDAVFARWGQLCGITYVYEPNDDGVTMNINPGILGTRADLRIGAKTLDGFSGVLAYNQFPNDGDMVLDAFDGSFNSTSLNSRFLRNVVSHEHGHGMGQLHVCPVNETKLMEPFVSTAYDGPRHDDVRNAQRHYGDPFEPNNSLGQATDLGAMTAGQSQNLGLVPSPSIPSTSILSIDANGEVDYFKFSIAGAATVNVTLIPQGFTYDDSDQSCGGSSGCCSGNNTNSLAIADLAFDVLGPNSSTVISTRNNTAAGSSESLSNISLAVAGTYYVRVYEVNSPAESQLYRLAITLGAPAFVAPTITFPNSIPGSINNGETTTFDVTITPNDDTIVPGSQQLFYRLNGGAYNSVPLAPVSGSLYQATLPAVECTDFPEFYVAATGTTAGLITNPTGGASSPYSVQVGPPALEDDFEADLGWTVATTATGGFWERGVPVNFGRGDPPSDFDGSGSCYLTENNSLTDNSDVDSGETVLTSPPFPTETGDTISYAYWFNDFTGGLLQGGDSLRVEIATDAGATNWTSIRNYTTASASWRTDSIVAGTHFTPSSTTRIRFTANDIGTQNIVEAGIDAVLANGCLPFQTAPDAPTGLAASDGGSCDDISLSWNAAAGADSYEVWRNGVNNPGTATLIAPVVVGTNYVDSTAPAASTQFYWVTACNNAGCSGFSAPDSGSRLDVPAAPTGLAATLETVCGAVDLNWNDVPEAATFSVWRNTVNDFGTATTIGSTDQLSLRDSTGDPALQYFYWVTANGDCGSSLESLNAVGSAAPKGDFNFDGFVDGADIQGFVGAMLGDAAFFDCADLAAPFGTLDEDDTIVMVNILTAP